ncbi:hypothetical protein QDW33_gp53 [Microbacterium phage Doobus]|uniref:hypothetical protein n=1 Tax=Microbacterium phage Doobus TaxID=2871539 RepID=UPI001E7CE669|nr:hypothetical protein QDW33_gp53 [Microbacterium phage Doobus]QZE10273.1 hypothetical protein SEA_DOOBUS_53 [Microbacterium phage Doobus]
MSTSTTFTDALEAALPKQTAGSLPSTRTFGMVTEAIESRDVDALIRELEHTRAHYQSLEYMLNSEDQIAETIINSFTDPAARAAGIPEPTTLEEVVRFAVRVYANEVLGVAYDTAHQVGLPMALMGLDVQGALQMIYSDLDYSDPARELTEDDIAELLGKPEDDED